MEEHVLYLPRNKPTLFKNVTTIKRMLVLLAPKNMDEDDVLFTNSTLYQPLLCWDFFLAYTP